MAKRKYTPQVQKSLGDVLKQRKDFYVKTLSSAFEGLRESLPQVLEETYQSYVAILERAYKCGNLPKIEEAERGALRISNKLANVSKATYGLAQLIGEGQGRPVREITRDNALREIPGEEARPTVDNRPRLTYHQFAKAVKGGMNYEQIKAKFRLKSNYQMGGFAKALKQRTQAVKKKK